MARMPPAPRSVQSPGTGDIPDENDRNAGRVMPLSERTERYHKADVGYQARPRQVGDVTQECDGCTMFEAPDKCTIVMGRINPKGWCSQFEDKETEVKKNDNEGNEAQPSALSEGGGSTGLMGQPPS